MVALQPAGIPLPASAFWKPNQVIDPRSQSGTTNCDRVNLARQTPPTHCPTKLARQEGSCNSTDRVLTINIFKQGGIVSYVYMYVSVV